LGIDRDSALGGRRLIAVLFEAGMHGGGHLSVARNHPGAAEPLLLGAPQAVGNKETDESDGEA